MSIIFFSSQDEFRKWLHKNHKRETKIIVGFYKVDSGKPSITWSQSVDEALCFGWIDGIRKSVDSGSYCIRFTPRKTTSIWSNVNVKKVEELIAKNLMYPAGLEIYNNRKDHKTGIYSYEKKPTKLTPDFEKKFKANKTAWEFFSKQPPYYKKTIYYWVLSAKQAKTQLSRLEKLIAESEKQKRIF